MRPDLFFGHSIDMTSSTGKCAVLLLAVLLGGIVGLERQLRGNSAGLRTHILVCLGSTVLTLTSVEIGIGLSGVRIGDPARLAAQIVSGIGFLGAGAIMREGAMVRGMTTAASIWVTAAIGISLGASPHLGELAVMATGLVLVTLAVLSRLEIVFNLRADRHGLDVEVDEADNGPTRVLDAISSMGIVVYSVQSEAGEASLRSGGMRVTRMMHLRAGLPRDFNRNAFNIRMTETDGVIAFHLD